MTTVDWLLLSLALVIAWVPALLFLGSDLLRLLRRKRAERRMARKLVRDAEAYAAIQAFRPLNLDEPRGRERLGLNPKEEE